AGVSRGELEGGFRGLGALEKEGDGGRVGEDLRSGKLCEVRERQGWDGKFLFALDMQGGAAGHQELEVRTEGQEVRQLWGCWQELLEVIEHEQQVLVHQKSCEQVLQRSRSALFDAECLSDGGNDQVGIADGSK